MTFPGSLGPDLYGCHMAPFLNEAAEGNEAAMMLSNSATSAGLCAKS